MKWLYNILMKISKTNALCNASGEHEIAYFELVYRFSYLLGISQVNEGCAYLLYSIIVKMGFLWFILSEVIYLFTMKTLEPSFNEYVDSINATIIYLLTFYRYISMISNKVIFKELSNSMKSPHFDICTDKRKEIFLYWKQCNEKYFKALITLGTVTLSVWHSYPILDDVEYKLVASVWIPFDYANPTYYPFVFIFVSVIFIYAAYFVMANDLIMQAHFLHLLCQFDILNDCLENIVEDCRQGFDDDVKHCLHLNEEFVAKYNQRLRNLVEQHKLILKNTMKLRKILDNPMLGQLSVSTLLLCCVGFQASASASFDKLSKFMMSLLFLAYNLIQLFIFCKWGEEIKVQSEKVGDSAYFSRWEEVSLIPEVRARLLMIMARASRPVALTAGGVYELSLRCFASIVKTSYSALSVLLSRD